MRDPSHVVMIGTSFETRGGIAAVLQAYRAAGLFDRWPVDYVATHRDGSALLRLLKAIDGLFRFLALACRHRRAVLHVHSASRASFWRKSVFMSLALLARWPVIFHLHGGGFATFYDAECGPVARAVVRFFLDHAACIVVVSERWCAWMHRATRNPRVVVIANAVSLPPAAAQREPALVAFAGRCSAQKGVPELLRSAAALAGRFPALRVECAGDGDLDAMRAQARALGLGGRVDFPGWIGPRQRADLLARATVFVLPSRAEGLPMALLEAMAAGCPVIASAVGGIPDLISDGFNGLLVPPGDAEALARALERLLADPPLAYAMGRAARATIASRFTAERAVERVGRLYAELGVPSLESNHRESSPVPGRRGDSPIPAGYRGFGPFASRRPSPLEKT
jgi:glycosyltransferase involved in cell wall biosynthesis